MPLSIRHTSPGTMPRHTDEPRRGAFAQALRQASNNPRSCSLRSPGSRPITGHSAYRDLSQNALHACLKDAVTARFIAESAQGSSLLDSTVSAKALRDCAVNLYLLKQMDIGNPRIDVALRQLEKVASSYMARPDIATCTYDLRNPNRYKHFQGLKQNIDKVIEHNGPSGRSEVFDRVLVDLAANYVVDGQRMGFEHRAQGILDAEGAGRVLRHGTLSDVARQALEASLGKAREAESAGAGLNEAVRHMLSAIDLHRPLSNRDDGKSPEGPVAARKGGDAPSYVGSAVGNRMENVGNPRFHNEAMDLRPIVDLVRELVQVRNGEEKPSHVLWDVIDGLAGQLRKLEERMASPEDWKKGRQSSDSAFDSLSLGSVDGALDDETPPSFMPGSPGSREGEPSLRVNGFERTVDETRETRFMDSDSELSDDEDDRQARRDDMPGSQHRTVSPSRLAHQRQTVSQGALQRSVLADDSEGDNDTRPSSPGELSQLPPRHTLSPASRIEQAGQVDSDDSGEESPVEPSIKTLRTPIAPGDSRQGLPSQMAPRASRYWVSSDESDMSSDEDDGGYLEQALAIPVPSHSQGRQDETRSVAAPVRLDTSAAGALSDPVQQGRDPHQSEVPPPPASWFSDDERFDPSSLQGQDGMRLVQDIDEQPPATGLGDLQQPRETPYVRVSRYWISSSSSEDSDDESTGASPGEAHVNALSEGIGSAVPQGASTYSSVSSSDSESSVSQADIDGRSLSEVDDSVDEQEPLAIRVKNWQSTKDAFYVGEPVEHGWFQVDMGKLSAMPPITGPRDNRHGWLVEELLTAVHTIAGAPEPVLEFRRALVRGDTLQELQQLRGYDLLTSDEPQLIAHIERMVNYREPRKSLSPSGSVITSVGSRTNGYGNYPYAGTDDNFQRVIARVRRDKG